MVIYGKNSKTKKNPRSISFLGSLCKENYLSYIHSYMTIHSFFYKDFKAINPIILTLRELKCNISFLLVEVKTIMSFLDPLRRKKTNTEWPINYQ